MNDRTHPQRALRLLRGLARRPLDLPRYLRYLPAWGRWPADVEQAWISFGAIDYLTRRLGPATRVFEFGSGGSSFFFARRAGSVHSVENDAAWQHRVATLARERGLTNLRCEHHPIDTRRPDLYPGLSYLSALQPNAHDIIVVDGFCDFENAEHGLLRDLTFDRAVACVRRPGGIIVVDDYWRYTSMAARAPEARLTVFESTGPCRYGVTSTAVFEF
jgi:hypothetical protein